MSSIINMESVLSVVNNYYSTAAATGYIKHNSVIRIMAYMFLCSFADKMYPYFEDDKIYRLIDKALVNVYANGGCLFPYNADNAGMFYVGETHFPGNNILRITNNNIMRDTEQSYLRRVV